MLDHPIVDVALGLILLYTVLSLFASIVKEWISTLLGLRAKNLEKGIKTAVGQGPMPIRKRTCATGVHVRGHAIRTCTFATFACRCSHSGCTTASGAAMPRRNRRPWPERPPYFDT